MGNKMFSAVISPPSDFVQKDDAFRTNICDKKLHKHKFTSYEYAGALAKWLFLKNRPTRLNGKYMAEFVLFNDLHRTCSVMPVSALSCDARDSENFLGCKKCTMRCSVLDCHDMVTSMFVIYVFWYLKYISENRTEVSLKNETCCYFYY